jgi:hypothetical protein
MALGGPKQFTYKRLPGSLICVLRPQAYGGAQRTVQMVTNLNAALVNYSNQSVVSRLILSEVGRDCDSTLKILTRCVFLSRRVVHHERHRGRGFVFFGFCFTFIRWFIRHGIVTEVVQHRFSDIVSILQIEPRRQ